MSRKTMSAEQILWQVAVADGDKNRYVEGTLKLGQGHPDRQFGPVRVKPKRKQTAQEAESLVLSALRSRMSEYLRRVGWDDTLPDEEWGDFTEFYWAADW